MSYWQDEFRGQQEKRLEADQRRVREVDAAEQRVNEKDANFRLQRQRAERAEARSQAAHEMRIEAEQEAAAYREALEKIAEDETLEPEYRQIARAALDEGER